MNAHAFTPILVPAVNAALVFQGVNKDGWYVFKAEGLTAYQTVWIGNWCVAAAGSGCASHTSPPVDEKRWSYDHPVDRYGNVWQSGAARHQPVTVFLGSEVLAEMFSDLWCAFAIEEAVRTCRTRLDDMQKVKVAAVHQAAAQALAALGGKVQP
jgi:hypothetical protein